MPSVTYPNETIEGQHLAWNTTIVNHVKWRSISHTGWKGGDRVSPYPFTRTVQSIESFSVIKPAEVGFFAVPSGPYETPQQIQAESRARNLSYERLRSKFHNDVVANLGETLGEWRSALEMAGNRSSQLADVVKKIGLKAQGKWRRLPQRKKPRSKSARTAVWSHLLAGTWLELQFGWLPLMGDLYASYQVLSSDIRPVRLYATASVPFTRNRWSERRQYNEHVGKAVYRQGAEFKVVNPNLALADQLGIINPLSVAWALTRLSFFVDWCFDVSPFLRSITDYAGVEVTKPYNTKFVLEYKHYIRMLYAYNPGTVNLKVTELNKSTVRQLGLAYPLPNVAVSGNLGYSLKRAINAASVLRLQFPKYWKLPK